MADETRIHATVAVKLLFEGKNHQSLVDILAQQSNPPLPPSPELRTNVIHDRNTALPHLPSHPPVESRRIDHDGQPWTASISFRNQLVKQTIDLRQMADDL